MTKTAIIIPAYNASTTLEKLISQLTNYVPPKDIIVIDDGSMDDTYKIAKDKGAVIIQHEKNKGKGVALKTGFEYCLNHNYSGIITMDADLQHDPKFVQDFLKMAKSSNYGIIIGTRQMNLKIMPLDRYLTNKICSIIISILSGKTIHDSQSGYRWISKEVLEKVNLSSRRYDLESEILIKAGRGNFEIGEVEISTIYEKSKSFINPFVDTGRFIKVLIKSIFW
ncbi:MAG TPA: glycosyltransferase family 2 protein [candidate division Zixibacteria bacterium]